MSLAPDELTLAQATRAALDNLRAYELALEPEDVEELRQDIAEAYAMLSAEFAADMAARQHQPGT